MQGLAAIKPVLVALICVAVATTASAAPSTKKKLAKQIVALVPVTADGNVAKTQLDTVDRALANSAGQHADVVAVRALDKRVPKGSFPGAVKACKGDGPCLTKLARAAKVDVIVAPTAKADSDGVTVTTTVAGANDTIHKVSFTFATAADLNAAIAKNAGELFSSGQTATEEPALESLAALPLEPLEAGQTPVASTPPVVTPTEPPVVAKTDTPPPDETRKGKGKNGKTTAEPTTTPPPAVDVTTAPLQLEAPMGTTAVMPPPRSEPHRIGWGTYAGAGIAAVGIAGITYGIIEYTQHKNIVNDANSNTTLTQREAQAQEQAAKSKYDHSRIGLYAGVPLLVIGGALIAWDIAIADHDKSAATEPETHLKLAVTPNFGGAYGAATLTW